MGDRTRVLIADDHPIFREGLVRIIERDASMEIVAQCGDGGEALRKIQEEHPDVAILDISMPTVDGLEVAREVQANGLRTKFIILTMYKDEKYFDVAMDLGIKGYVLKDGIATELSQCLRAVSGGNYYISPAISALLIDRKLRLESLTKTTPGLNSLTMSERHILKLLAQNKTSKEIADALFISVRTVENHRTHICNKLGIKGHNKLLHFAIEHKAVL